MYIVGGWYGSENGDGLPIGVPGYHAEPVGYGALITRATNTLKTKEFKAYAKNFTIPSDLPAPAR